MELQVYSVRDAKAEIFNQPFLQKTHGEAERTFKNLVSDPNSTVGKFPEDYSLYYLGTYDDSKGLYQSLAEPQHIIKAVNCLAKIQ